MWALVGTCLDYTPFLAHFTAETAASDTRVSSVAVTQTGLQDFQLGTAANTLKQLGDLTGGTVYQDTDTGKAVREAVETSKVRYRLEFAPAAWDGKYHKVRVACTREGVRIVAPQAYFASMP